MQPNWPELELVALLMRKMEISAPVFSIEILSWELEKRKYSSLSGSPSLVQPRVKPLRWPAETVQMRLIVEPSG